MTLDGGLKNGRRRQMNPATFCNNMARVVTGQGFKRSIPGIDINSLRLATGAILVADSGNPGRVILESYFEGVVLPSSQTDLGTLTFMVPRDYDATVDKMRIRFLCNSGGTADSPTLDAAVYVKKPGTALSADVNPTASAVISKASATTGASWREIVVEGQELEPGDAVTCILVTGGTRGTTDTVAIYALEVAYMGDLAYYEEDERDDWA
jgi:hypothetical protein